MSEAITPETKRNSLMQNASNNPNANSGHQAAATTAAYTPWPWATESIVSENGMGGELFVIPEDNSENWIAKMAGHNSFKADARLIAAAPELLSALRDLIEDAECETCDKCDGEGVNPRCKTDACHACAGAGEIVRHPIWPQFLTNAIAALNKAEGNK